MLQCTDVHEVYQCTLSVKCRCLYQIVLSDKTAHSNASFIILFGYH